MSLDLTKVLNLDEFESLARQAMPHPVYEYVSAGVADEVTLKANRAAYGHLRLLPRALVDVSRIDTAVTLFGRRHVCPLLLAPCGYHKLVHPEGELEVARGAEQAEVTFITGCFATVSMEETAAASRQPLWFQLYVHPDRGVTRSLVERAEAAGYEALVVTVDVPVNGPRDRELRAGFSLPPGVVRANLMSLGAAVAGASHRPSGRNIYAAVRAPDVTWNDIAWLKSVTRMPVIVKGILRPDDAAAAIEAGADAIYVSNHGGRSVDTLPAALDVLPAVASRVDVPVLFDGGVRRGTDAFKALALGARAVLMGRPYLYGLALGGAAGVVRAVEILRTELEMTMGFLGITSLAAIDRSTLYEG